MLEQKPGFDEIVVWVGPGGNDVSRNFWAIVRGNSKALMLPRLGDLGAVLATKGKPAGMIQRSMRKAS